MIIVVVQVHLHLVEEDLEDLENLEDLEKLENLENLEKHANNKKKYTYKLYV